MAQSCIYVPTTGKDMREGEPSRLWNELMNFTGSREDTIDVFSVYRAFKNEIDKLDGVEFYENGEPTLDSIVELFKLRELYKDNSLLYEKQDIGATDKENKRVYYDTLEQALRQIIPYIKEHSDLIATPIRSVNGKYYIELTSKRDSSKNKERISGVEAKEKLQEAVFTNELSKRLFSIMNQLGFTVVYDDEVASGIFDPKNAETLANGMKAVIRIARGEVGEHAFVEEFSHFLIAGMKNEPLVQRALARLDNENILREILSDSIYAKYFEEYSSDMGSEASAYETADEALKARMRNEALGHLLADVILKKQSSTNDEVTNNFLVRIWNFIKSRFSKLTSSLVDNMINDSRKEMERLLDIASDNYGKKVFNKEEMLDSDYLLSMAEKSNKLQKMAHDQWTKYVKIKKRYLEATKVSPRPHLAELSHYNKHIAQEKYAESCLFFVKSSEKELKRISDNLNYWNDVVFAKAEKIEVAPDKFIPVLTTSQQCALASVVVRILDYSKGYESCIRDLKLLPELLKKGEVDLSENSANYISGEAYNMDKMLDKLNMRLEDLRYIISYNFLKELWGEDKMKRGKLVTLNDLMLHGERNLGIFDRFVSSMGESHDELLNMYNAGFKRIEAASFGEMREFEMTMREILEEYRLATGSTNTDFFYEKDENGIPTGWLISNINFRKFYNDLDALVAELKEQGKKPWEIRQAVDKFKKDNMEEMDINGNVMNIPKSSKPSDPYFVDNLSKLNEAQRRFYDKGIEAKKKLDSKLPFGKVNLYQAVQIENSTLEVLDKGGSLQDLWHVKKSEIGDKFMSREYDTEFGMLDIDENDQTHVKRVKLNVAGTDLERNVPMYYINRLRDMRRLSTDFVGSMMAYSASCISYDYMSRFLGVFELGKSLLENREVDERGIFSKVKFDTVPFIKSLQRYKKDLDKEEIESKHTTLGGNIVKKYADWMDMAIYKHYKNDEGSIKIGNKEVDIAKTVDAFKQYTGNLGLAINIFSATSNVLMGKMQMFININVQRGFYSAADAARSIGVYYQLLPDYLGELASTHKNSKMSLLIDNFDMLEEYYRSLSMQGKFTGAFGKIFNGKSIQFMNNAGEHYLHVRTGLTILFGYKVTVEGKEMTLYDAMEVVNHKDQNGNILSSELVFKEGTKTDTGITLMTEKLTNEYRKLRDAKKLTESEKLRLKELKAIKTASDQYLYKVKDRINYVNGTLNGFFNENDIGAINKMSIGRLLKQFRQWMPAHYSRRFKDVYFNARIGEYTEGYYRTFGRFLKNLACDLKAGQFDLGTRLDSMEENEKENVWKAFFELSAFVILSLLVSVSGKWKDKETPWAKRFALYNMKRLKLEVGASIPWKSFFTNFFKMCKDPAAALRTSQNLIDIIFFTDIFNDVQTGSNKGMNKWLMNVIRNTPVVNNVNRVKDFAEENYLFNALD